MRRTELRSSPQCLTYARRRWPPSITVRAMCTRPVPNFGPTRRDHEGAARGTPGDRVTCAPHNPPFGPWLHRSLVVITAHAVETGVASVPSPPIWPRPRTSVSLDRSRETGTAGTGGTQIQRFTYRESTHSQSHTHTGTQNAVLGLAGRGVRVHTVSRVYT